MLPGEAFPLAVFPNLARRFAAIDARPAVARALRRKDRRIQRGNDEETRRALFPSNYPTMAK